MRKAVRVRITGRVQGVWFRAWMVEQASSLGLSGWVCNRPDHSVEALFAGPRESVAKMVRACQDGPPHARVDRVEESPAEDPGDVGFGSAPGF